MKNKLMKLLLIFFAIYFSSINLYANSSSQLKLVNNLNLYEEYFEDLINVFDKLYSYLAKNGFIADKSQITEYNEMYKKGKQKFKNKRNQINKDMLDVIKNEKDFKNLNSRIERVIDEIDNILNPDSGNSDMKSDDSLAWKNTCLGCHSNSKMEDEKVFKHIGEGGKRPIDIDRDYHIKNYEPKNYDLVECKHNIYLPDHHKWHLEHEYDK